jgi:hypothetical protein
VISTALIDSPVDPDFAAVWDRASREMPPLASIGRFVVVYDNGVRAAVVQSMLDGTLDLSGAPI